MFVKLETFLLSVLATCAVDSIGPAPDGGSGSSAGISSYPYTRECNVTLAAPGYVAVPDTSTYVVGTYLHCRTKIR